MAQCIFCKIARGEDSAHVVLWDPEVMAFLDIFPIVRGHCLVVVRAHHEHLLETPPPLAASMMAAVQRVAPAILVSVGAPAFNLVCSTGREAGQVIGHAHLHIIPRREGDGLSMWKGRKGEPEDLAALARQVEARIRG